MPERRNQSSRIYGSSKVANAGTSRVPALSTKGLTDEQKAEREAGTLAAYEVWKAERQARIEQNKQAYRLRRTDLT